MSSKSNPKVLGCAAIAILLLVAVVMYRNKCNKAESELKHTKHALAQASAALRQTNEYIQQQQQQQQQQQAALAAQSQIQQQQHMNLPPLPTDGQQQQMMMDAQNPPINL